MPAPSGGDVRVTVPGARGGHMSRAVAARAPSRAHAQIEISGTAEKYFHVVILNAIG
jgi:hypothetical protein